MTTNQTIDGVPRVLVEWMVNAGDLVEMLGLCSGELRDLLDAPADVFVDPLKSCDLCGHECKATQPKGEPVAWRYHDDAGSSPWFNGAPEQVNLEFVERRGGRVERAYAEQPAPVAVMLPERREIGPNYPYLSDLDIEWNACLDELKRLNPSL